MRINIESPANEELCLNILKRTHIQESWSKQKRKKKEVNIFQFTAEMFNSKFDYSRTYIFQIARKKKQKKS